MIKVYKDYDNIPRILLAPETVMMIHESLQKRTAPALSYLSNPLAKGEIKSALTEIYHHKCAYCETKTEIGIDHYRPKSKYYWIPLEWSNILPVCIRCNLAKGATFPLAIEAQRVNSPQQDRKEWRADSRTFLAENPLFLNPEIDEPSEHLAYYADGRVYGLTERGKATIQVLGLNRNDLLQKRQDLIHRYAQGFNNAITVMKQLKNDAFNAENQVVIKLLLGQTIEQIRANTTEESEFAGLHRFILENLGDFFVQTLEDDTTGFNKEALKTGFALFFDNKKEATGVKNNQKALPQKVTIENLEIKNIKCFEDTKIDFKGENTVLIGVNGRGKTTVLQLLALGLAKAERPPFNTEWKNVARGGSDAMPHFSIKLKINERSTELKYSVSEEDNVFSIDEHPSKVLDSLFFVVYGMARNIESDNRIAESLYPNFKNIATLFGINNLYFQNGAVTDFMKQDFAFRQIKSIITKIFNKAEDLENRIELSTFKDGTFYFDTPTNKQKNLIPLNAMSSGFRTSFIWVLDLAIRAWKAGFDLEKPETIVGIVIIDEIDIHLHIKWQRAILTVLQDVFKNLQFIVTTHSPFVVQSVSGSNLIELKIKKDYVEACTVTNDVSIGSSYETVINELFDETSTFSAKVQEDLDVFYAKKQLILDGSMSHKDPEFAAIVAKLQSFESDEINTILGIEFRQIKDALIEKRDKV